MTNWIVFDVDDVICNFRQSFYESFITLGKDIPWNSWENYSLIDIYGLKDETALHHHMRNTNVLENSVVESGVVEMLSSFKAAGYCVGLLTARAWHDKGLEITENFVNKYELPVDKIVISGRYKDKKSLHIDKFPGQVCAYVDDSIHHIEDFVEKGIKNSYLFDRPWNQECNLPRINDFNQFKDFVLK